MTRSLSKRKYITIESWLETGIIAGFVLFSLIGILQHEMWRDELQAWMIARDSSSILNLIQNMAYEGHPALWHLILYGLNQFTHDPLLMQLFHVTISIWTVYIVVKLSPFSLLHRFLLSFSYFLFFEYTVISRNYNLGVFLFFLFCALFDRKNPRYIILSIILALAANANFYALLVSVGLTVFVALDTVFFSRGFPRLKPNIAIAFLIVSSGWLISLVQILRVRISDLLLIPFLSNTAIGSPTVVAMQADASMESYLSLLRKAKSVLYAIMCVCESYFPLPNTLRVDFWETNIFTTHQSLPIDPDLYLATPFSIGELIALFISILMLGLFSIFFFKRKSLLCAYSLGNLLIILFIGGMHSTATYRHYGYLFITLIIYLWLFQKSSLAKDDYPSQHYQKFVNGVLTFILSVQAIAGIHAMSMDYLYPFSNSREVAQFIRDNNLQNQEIIGSRYRQASTLSGYLNVPVYYPEKQTLGTFWSERVPDIEQAEIMEQLPARLAATQSPQLTLVLTEELQAPAPAGLTIEPLKQFNETIVDNEQFYLYSVEKK
ncbi:hypothetical protein PN498_14125 [Oscillatoria sp. CS-180]|uniref:hypothetical protein n=1 Tax=Oscillatoria sp. CS-180 TaxID=3021720 RepID=UPI00232B8F04|nr:hypothetical protein [Oscillatoria sp. CS-180]MDB9527135.1 hypothetical protein [Oscillatoria sp. CS-180]